MWAVNILLIALFLHVTCEESQDPVLYYYGIDESERSLPLCGARTACSAVLRRYWRAPALVRLCRCPRRARCDRLLPPDQRVELSNRGHFQFCKPITDWPECSIKDVPLHIQSPYARLDPEEIEDLHHKNIQLAPPKVTFECRCRRPSYWKLNETIENEDIKKYRCAALPACRTGELCGHVTGDLYALYQSCMCPKHHICVQGGGLPETDISELLYRGKGWRAHCERFCKPITDWPECSIKDVPLHIQSPYARLDPEEIEDLHHKNIQLAPPKVTFECRCRRPSYWKLNETIENEDIKKYRCAALPACRTGELCGHVTGDLYALYQSCMCPKHHICVQGGGLPETDISELLYRGKGWRAHCERVSDDYSSEDY